MIDELKYKLICRLKNVNEYERIYPVNLAKLHNKSDYRLSFKFAFNLSMVVLIAILGIGAYLAEVRNSYFLTYILLIAYSYFFIKYFYNRLFKKNNFRFKPYQRELFLFKELNKLYKEEQGFVVYEPDMYYTETSEQVIVIFSKNGDAFHDVVQNVKEKLESALNMTCKDIKNELKSIYYIFDKQVAERYMYDEITLSSETMSIPLYDDIELDLRKNYSCLMSGRSGSGKSYMLYGMLAHFASKFTYLDGKEVSARVYVIDPKESDLYKHMQFAGFDKKYYGSTLSEAFSIIKDVTKEMEYRKKIYAESKVFDSTLIDMNYPPILVLIDEYSSLVNLMSSSKQRAEWDSLVGNLLRLSRQLSIGVWIVAQSADAKILGDSGVRAQLVNSIYMGMPTAQTAQMSFNCSINDLPLVTEKGDGLISIDGLEPRKFSAPTFTKPIDEVLQPVLKNLVSYLKVEDNDTEWEEFL